MGRAGKHARPHPVTATLLRTSTPSCTYTYTHPIMQFHCCINLYWLYHCCVHLLPILLLLCVWLFVFYLARLIMTPGNFHCCINGCIIAACIYSPFRFFVCVCGCSHLPCCINLYWLYYCCLHLLPILLLLCVWLFAFYLAWLIMTPFNFIAA